MRVGSILCLLVTKLYTFQQNTGKLTMASIQYLPTRNIPNMKAWIKYSGTTSG